MFGLGSRCNPEEYHRHRGAAGDLRRREIRGLRRIRCSDRLGHRSSHDQSDRRRQRPQQRCLQPEHDRHLRRWCVCGDRRADDRQRPDTQRHRRLDTPCQTRSSRATRKSIAAGATGQNSAEVNTNPSLSADGRYVAFASNIPPGGAALTARQVYVLDRATGATKVVTSTPGQLMPGDLDDPEITPDGSQVVLVQSAARTVNTKPVRQVFVARNTSGFFDAAAFDLVSYGVSGAPGSLDSALPSMSSNGRFVAFSSLANNDLSGTTLPGDLNVWMRERPIALDITPSLDFGTIDLGVQSPPQNAVVTNTSNVAINIGAVTSPAAPFSITANGCGGVLAPVRRAPSRSSSRRPSAVAPARPSRCRATAFRCRCHSWATGERTSRHRVHSRSRQDPRTMAAASSARRFPRNISL